MIKLIIIGWLILYTASAITRHPILIVVSFDAFRFDFIDSRSLPNLLKFRKEGTYAPYLVNVFPTKTFPNHQSIATGVYPGVHGVIANVILDTAGGKTITMSPKMYNFNADIVPIWTANELASPDRYSGVMMWPGGCYPYQNRTVTYCMQFNSSVPWTERVDIAVDWLTNNEKPINLLMLYIEEPDSTGHGVGPNAERITDLLHRLDNLSLYIDQKLIENNLKTTTHVIHLSDHGLKAVTPPKFLNITQYLTNVTYAKEITSPIAQFIDKSGSVFRNLKLAQLRGAYFKVYKKGDYPKRWQYDCSRSPDVLLVANDGYALEDLIISAPKYAKWLQFNLTNSSEFGVHGYDYKMPEMRPYFMARGPRIKPGSIVEPFHTVDLYNLFCDFLEITNPSLNNGSLENIKYVINRSSGGPIYSAIVFITVTAIMVCLILMQYIYKRYNKMQINNEICVEVCKEGNNTVTAVELQHLLSVEESN